MEGKRSLSGELEALDRAASLQGSLELTRLLQADQLVGDLLQIDYEECEIVVHDHLRQKVGGLPLGCFLLASRCKPGEELDCLDEDTSLILLRVVGKCRLPNAGEMDFSRFQAGQRASADPENWDAQDKTDQFTLHQLRFAGVRCRVLGTYRMRSSGSNKWTLTFGADISNFYSGRGMKVFKPIGEGLRKIVNFATSMTDESHKLHGRLVPLGRVRYASSERSVNPDGDNVAVSLDPTDLIARRTALFGMSRTGKSNTTKMIAKSVFGLREQGEDGRIGQLIFDVNGEYANENTQDGGAENASCLKNVGKHTKGASADDVSTYGMFPHPADPDRNIVKINFYGGFPASIWTDVENVQKELESLLVGKDLLDKQLASDTAIYRKNFRDTSLEVPAALDAGDALRYRRAIFAYRAALYEAGYPSPSDPRLWQIANLFGAELRDAMANSTGDGAIDYVRVAQLMANKTVTGDQAADICKTLKKFIDDGSRSGYDAFNASYASKPGKEGRKWDDPTFLGILEIFKQPNGVKMLRPLIQQHNASSVGDFAELIVDDLMAGKLVIYDQSMGDPDQNKAAAERIMWALFERQKQSFINPKKAADGNFLPPSDVIVYAEEAHNLLPAGSSFDTKNIWSRVTKEGSKYRIGLVYATQEPSTIQSNILKNTDNWFVAHLNNSDETKELRKYYDFDDFEEPILRVPDPGFIRMRTLSNPYIVPIQVDRFRVS